MGRLFNESADDDDIDYDNDDDDDDAQVQTHRYFVDEQDDEQDDEQNDQQEQTVPFVVVPDEKFPRLPRRRNPQKRRFRSSETSIDVIMYLPVCDDTTSRLSAD